MKKFIDIIKESDAAAMQPSSEEIRYAELRKLQKEGGANKPSIEEIRYAELRMREKQGKKQPTAEEVMLLQKAIRSLYDINPRREDLIVRVMRQLGFSHEKAMKETEFLYSEEK